MKPKSSFSRRNGLALIVFALPALAPSLHAAAITWANTGTDFNANASWVGAVAPTAADTATFTGARVTSPTLSAPATVSGLTFSNAAASNYAISGSTLTIGASGIDAAAVTSGTNTISSALTLASGGQVWTAGTGSILAVNPASFTREVGSTVKIDTTIGTGTVSTSTLVNTNGILGPWATIHSAGTSANNAVDGDTYATVTGGSIVPYTGATAVAGTGAWGGIPSGGTGTINYDSSGTMAVTGLVRDVNTIRYTGTGATQPSNINPVGNVLTLNGFMNAGSGEFFIGGTGGANQYGVNVTVGASLRLVLAPMTAGITLRNAILNNVGGASALTVSGNQTATLAGVSSYTGQTTVAAGTLLVSGTGAINTSSGIVINGATAKYLHTSSVASTPAIALNRGTLDGTGSLGAVTVANNTAAILANGNGGTTALTVGSLTFNGKSTLNLSRTNSTALNVTGALTTTPANGKVTLNATGTLWNLGANNVISSGSFAGAASDFQLGTVTGLSPRQTATGVVVSGTNVAIQVSGDTPAWTGAANGNWTTDTIPSPKNWKLQTAGTTTDFLTGDLCVFDDTATGTTTVDISSDFVSPASVTFNNSSKNYTLGSALGFGIATGALTKSGTGSLTIGGPIFNYFDGGTTFTGGTLVLNADSALGAGALTVSPGTPKTFDSTGGVTGLIVGSQNWNDDFTFTGTSDLDMGTGVVNLGGSGTDRTVTVSAGVLSVGEIKSTALNLVKQGSGKLVVNSVGNGVAGSQIVGTLNVTTGIFQINRTEVAAGFSGDFTVTGLAGTGSIVNGAAAERWLFVNTAVPASFGGTLANGGTGPLGFNKQGVGSMTLTNANSYTGATTIEGGSLVVANTAALGNTSLIRFLTGTTLDLATDSATTVWPVTFGSGVIANIVSNRATPGAGINHTLTTQSLANGMGGGTINVTSGANVTSGTGRITFNQLGFGAGTVQTTTLNPTTANVTLGDVGKQNNNISQVLGLGGTSLENLVTGVISDGPAIVTPNNVSVLKSGASVWTLSNTNTYTGTTTLGTGGLAAGVLRATANGALGTGTLIFDTIGNASDAQLKLSGGITLNNNVTFTPRTVTTPAIVNEGGDNTLGGIFTLGTGGNQARIQSDLGTLTLSGSITANTATARNLYLQGASNGIVSGVISDNSLDVNGKITVTKEGDGSWTLSNANTYTGATTVSAGTLNVTGSLAAGSAVTVAPGATLKGIGPVAGTVTAAGIVAPGTSAGTLTTGAATLTGTLAIEIDGAIGDKLVSTGAVDVTGATLTVSLLGGGFTQPSYIIAEGTSIAGPFASVPTGYSVNIVTGGAGQQAILTATATSGYASWASTNAGNGQVGGDFDLDGVSNGIEYFMNSAAGFTASPGVVGGVVTWPNGGNIPASAYGSQFVVQTSPNLTTWTPVLVGSLTTNTNSTLTYTLPTGAGKVFVRLVVTPN
ncbi:MAG: autotransporter-associated beta strand repeat-containing protein [Verrucomicrobiota bacterium]